MRIRDSKAADQRVKIYALLGIFSQALEPGIALTQVLGNSNVMALKLLCRFGVWLINKVKISGQGLTFSPLSSDAQL
jgi:hypothetical protein